MPTAARRPPSPPCRRQRSNEPSKRSSQDRKRSISCRGAIAGSQKTRLCLKFTREVFKNTSTLCNRSVENSTANPVTLSTSSTRGSVLMRGLSSFSSDIVAHALFRIQAFKQKSLISTSLTHACFWPSTLSMSTYLNQKGQDVETVDKKLQNIQATLIGS